MLKKKRYFILPGLLLAALCGLLGLAACGGEHVHAWGEWETVTAPTCTAEGTEQRVCPDCGETETRPAAMLSHTYSEDWRTVKAATCLAEGEESNICDLCGTEQTRSTPKTGHTPADVEKLDPTCLLPGHEAGTECAVCGVTLSGLQPIDALGHDYGDWQRIKTPTCTDQGLDRRTCRRDGCGAVEDNVLDMTEHTIEEFGDEKAANCTEAGSKKGERCSVCQHVIKEAETVPALGHKIQTPQHVEENGTHYHAGYCSRCEQQITKEECNFNVTVTAATCTTAEHHVHLCPTCNYKYEHDDGDPLGHNFGDWHFDVQAYDASLRDADGAATVVRRHIRTCTNPGHVEDPDFPEVETCGAEVMGEPVAATCTTSGYTNYRCGTCENTYTGDKKDALGHQWKQDGNGKLLLTYEKYHGMDTHYKECGTCGQRSYYGCRYENARYLPADCEHGKRTLYTCADCKEEIVSETGSPLGHAYGGWIHDDETSGEDSKHYRICGRAECGHREEADCVMQSSDVAPTCQKPGKAIRICKDCKYNEEGGEIAMLEHDVADQPYLPDRAKKSHYQECKRCGVKVYGECPYELTVTPKSCTEDESTKYYCPTCKDEYTIVTRNSAGHIVTQYTDSDRYYHRGQCDICRELVSVAHDFSESNICTVCHADGLAYAFEAGSNNTRAKVIRDVKDGAYRPLLTPKIVIPATVDIDGRGEVPVVGIASDAFYGNTVLEEAEFPLSLEYIGYHAFQGCAKLERVHFTGYDVGATDVAGCKLNRIEMSAFRECVALTNAILPDSLQFIGQEAFRGCTKLDDIVIPALVTEIEDHAFTDTKYFNDADNWTGDVLYIGPHLIRARTSLTGAEGMYKVNDNVVSISAEAFMDCKYLTGIELPATLKAIDRDAFKGCAALQTVVFDGTFAQYVGIRFDNDAASPMHFATTLTIAGAVGTPTLPEGTTVIPAGAFRGSDIESIVIPASVTSIGANAFADCARLASITFENGSKLLTVGADLVKGTAYYGNAANWTNGGLYLKEEGGTPVALVAVDPAKVTAAYTPYPGESFEGSAKQFEIADGTRTVAPAVFKGFDTLRYVVVPDTVLYIGEGVFEGCTLLDRVDFRGAGKSWFCYSAQLGRVYADAKLYGGDSHDAYANQKYAAGLFSIYPLQWKRTGV